MTATTSYLGSPVDDGGSTPVVSGEPTNSPGAPNQSGWLDEMDAATFPTGVWTSTGAAVTPTFVSAGVTAYQWSLSAGQRVEAASLLAPTRLDSPGAEILLVARLTAASTQELLLGLTNEQADTLGTSPTDGAWVSRDSGGVCRLRVASASSVVEAVLAFPLPASGWFDLSLWVRASEGGTAEARAFVAGLPAAVLGCPAPTGWLSPRVAVKGAGALALDRMGRSTVGLPTGDYL